VVVRMLQSGNRQSSKVFESKVQTPTKMGHNEAVRTNCSNELNWCEEL